MAVSIVTRGSARVDRRAVRRLIDAILRDHSHEDSDVSVVFTTDDDVRCLNREYRNTDRPTDVLAFAGAPGDGLDGPETVLGDVVISVDRAAVQARRFRRTFDREILKLAAHGLLHLLGHDHETHAERSAMRRLENRYVLSVADAGRARS